MNVAVISRALVPTDHVTISYMGLDLSILAGFDRLPDCP